MKWLTLSSAKFEPIPDIQFSFKKPLFAASVVLRYSREGSSAVRGFVSLDARIPLKGPLGYQIEALSGAGRVFGFEFIRESDVVGGSARESRVMHAGSDAEWLEVDGARVDIVNESPAPIMAHVLALPAFAQTHTTDEALYAGHIMVGRKVQALRLMRIGPAADALARTKYDFRVETYEGRLISVPRALDEEAFQQLAWGQRTPFEFDWDVEQRKVVAARFQVPIFGKFEIKA